MAQSLDVVVRLLRGEVVTEETDWYKLQDARLHLMPVESQRVVYEPVS